MLKNCVICGCEFEAKQNKKCCSISCSSVVKKHSRKAWKEKNPEKVRKQQREKKKRYYHKYPEKRKAKTQRDMAKRSAALALVRNMQNSLNDIAKDYDV
jgi:hypothetical protein